MNVSTICLQMSRKFINPESPSHQFAFGEFLLKTGRFNLILARLSNNTFVLAVLPPGEAELNCARINVTNARDQFFSFDPPKHRGGRVLSEEKRSVEEAPNKATANGVAS